jgi:hypothetical protein
VTQAYSICVTENAAIHEEQSETSAINIDQAAGSMWMTKFSVTLIPLTYFLKSPVVKL